MLLLVDNVRESWREFETVGESCRRLEKVEKVDQVEKVEEGRESARKCERELEKVREGSREVVEGAVVAPASLRQGHVHYVFVIFTKFYSVLHVLLLFATSHYFQIIVTTDFLLVFNSLNGCVRTLYYFLLLVLLG